MLCLVWGKDGKRKGGEEGHLPSFGRRDEGMEEKREDKSNPPRPTKIDST